MLTSFRYRSTLRGEGDWCAPSLWDISARTPQTHSTVVRASVDCDKFSKQRTLSVTVSNTCRLKTWLSKFQQSALRCSFKCQRRANRDQNTHTTPSRFLPSKHDWTVCRPPSPSITHHNLQIGRVDSCETKQTTFLL